MSRHSHPTLCVITMYLVYVYVTYHISTAYICEQTRQTSGGRALIIGVVSVAYVRVNLINQHPQHVSSGIIERN